MARPPFHPLSSHPVYAGEEEDLEAGFQAHPQPPGAYSRSRGMEHPHDMYSPGSYRWPRPPPYPAQHPYYRHHGYYHPSYPEGSRFMSHAPPSHHPSAYAPRLAHVGSAPELPTRLLDPSWLNSTQPQPRQQPPVAASFGLPVSSQANLSSGADASKQETLDSLPELEWFGSVAQAASDVGSMDASSLQRKPALSSLPESGGASSRPRTRTRIPEDDDDFRGGSSALSGLHANGEELGAFGRQRFQSAGSTETTSSSGLGRTQAGADPPQALASSVLPARREGASASGRSTQMMQAQNGGEELQFNSFFSTESFPHDIPDLVSVAAKKSGGSSKEARKKARQQRRKQREQNEGNGPNLDENQNESQSETQNETQNDDGSEKAERTGRGARREDDEGAEQDALGYMDDDDANGTFLDGASVSDDDSIAREMEQFRHILIQSSADLNHYIADNGLSTQMALKLKDMRRRMKNREYAQRSRKKRMARMSRLETMERSFKRTVSQMQVEMDSLRAANIMLRRREDALATELLRRRLVKDADLAVVMQALPTL